jgi:hypothetical protein
MLIIWLGSDIDNSDLVSFKFESPFGKDSLGFSFPIFCIINSLVFLIIKNQFTTTVHSVRFVLSSFFTGFTTRDWAACFGV